MGLDMYLYKDIYIGANYDWKNIKGSIDLSINDIPVPVNMKRVSSIVESVGYWRKANAIHSWFVNNCQEGVDDCRRSHVDNEQLAELLDICERVLADHSLAEDELPTEGGFFFGGTGYDEWYFDKLQETVDIIKPILSEPEVDGVWVSYYYQSSW